MENEILLITGAGVDKTKDIGFPLANTLLSEVAKFSEIEGKEYSDMLKGHLSRVQFVFSKIISQSIDKITNKEIYEYRILIEQLQRETKSYESSKDDKELRMYKLGCLLQRLFNKLVSITESASIDDEIKGLIEEIFGDEAGKYLDSDDVININKMSLSDSFKSILKYTLNLSLKEDNKIADVLCSEMMNIENLLIEKFLGFYTNKTNDIKNYIYISWMLWAYLVCKENSISKTSGLPFYSKIPKNYRAITLNYTSFLERQLGKDNVLYFHGGLTNAIYMERRETTEIKDISKIDIKKYFENDVLPNIDVSEDNNSRKTMIPSIIPPLKLKPILSSKNIEQWYDAMQWIKEASTIIVVGYSFNGADEHFNDLIRKNISDKRFFIIAPDALEAEYLKKIHNIFGVSDGDWHTKTIMGKQAKEYNERIFLIGATAADVDFNVFEN